MVTIMAYLPPSPSKGEEVDDHGQFKQETVAVKQEVADDFMANLEFDSSTDEWALSPDHPILVHDGLLQLLQARARKKTIVDSSNKKPSRSNKKSPMILWSI